MNIDLFSEKRFIKKLLWETKIFVLNNKNKVFSFILWIYLDCFEFLKYLIICIVIYYKLFLI